MIDGNIAQKTGRVAGVPLRLAGGVVAVRWSTVVWLLIEQKRSIPGDRSCRMAANQSVRYLLEQYGPNRRPAT
jgi:hypothetical protein